MLLRALILIGLLAGFTGGPAFADGAPPSPQHQTEAEAKLKSVGCMSCHTQTDSVTAHTSPGVILGCADCHGGNSAVVLAPGTPKDSPEYRRTLDAAHVQPRFPEAWNYPSSVKPARTYSFLNKESPEFIRFMNPGSFLTSLSSMTSTAISGMIPTIERIFIGTNWPS